MDCHDRVGAIVLAAQHLLDLGSLDFGLQGFERTLQVDSYVFAAVGPFEQDAEIVEFAHQRIAQLDFFAQTAAALQQLLRFGLVGPEVGSSNALL
jgi:hypothetical protein